MKMDSLSLNQAYDIIDDYAIYASINFDVFTFSKHSTFNLLVFLLNKIMASLQIGNLSFKPEPESVANQMNRMFEMFLMDFRVTKLEVMRVNLNPAKIIKSLAFLIRDRLKPLYTIIQSQKLNEDCKKECDIDEEDSAQSMLQNIQNDLPNEFTFDRFKQIVQAGISSEDFKSTLDIASQAKAAILYEKIAKTLAEIDRLKRDTAEDEGFIRSSDEMFRDEAKFRQVSQDLEGQQGKLLKTYNATIKLYQKVALRNVWKEPREYLQSLRTKFPDLDGVPNRGIQLIDKLLEHMDQLEDNPEMIQEHNRSKIKSWIQQTNNLMEMDNRILEQKLKDAQKLLESKRKNFLKKGSSEHRPMIECSSVSSVAEPESNEDLKQLRAKISTLSRLEQEADAAYRKLQEEILKEKSQQQNQSDSLKQEIERLKQELVQNIQDSPVAPSEEFLNKLPTVGIEPGSISTADQLKKRNSRRKKK